MENKSKMNSRIIFGLTLIVFGGLFLLDSKGIINFSLRSVLWHWEYILIAIGIFLLATSQNKTAGIILLAIGAFNLFPEFWPLLLVGLGIYIILKRNNPHSSRFNVELNATGSEEEKSEFNSEKLNSDLIDDVSIFGGGTKTFYSENFKGGKLTAIFGGAELHLERCKLSKEKNVIDVFTMFGGYTIHVPREWEVVVDVIPIFGGFSDSRPKDPNKIYDEEKVVVVKGLAIFGGGEIK